MKVYLTAIRDIVADVFGPPECTHNLGHAVRQFGDRCQDKSQGNIVGQHPEDFELWHIGNYDDAHANFEVEEMNRDDAAPIFEKKQIAVGANYRKQ